MWYGVPGNLKGNDKDAEDWMRGDVVKVWEKSVLVSRDTVVYEGKWDMRGNVRGKVGGVFRWGTRELTNWRNQKAQKYGRDGGVFF